MPETTHDPSSGGLGVLGDLLRGTASTTGRDFFRALAENLASAVSSHMAWVTEYRDGDDTLTALAMVTGDELQTDYRYPLAGTPCEGVIRNSKIVHHVDDVQACYPDDRDLQALGVCSYFGIPLLDTNGVTLGHLAVMDTAPMPEEPVDAAVLQIFAARAASELQRMRAEREQDQLKRLLQQANEALTQSEQRFRDLFEEAPIAYVHEDLETRFIRANRTALNILGLTPDDVPHTYGRSLARATPEARQRVDEAVAVLGTGRSAAAIVLELQRKDNGEPVWIQWWSTPAPDGTYTRTMFIDITDRVLMGREKALLEAENAYLREEVEQPHNADIIGTSPGMAQVYEDLRQVAATDTTVLVLGETGTGKELAARAVHAASKRRSRPLIKVNCAALPATLIEAELFGHEKGAFTGATRARDGRFALADGGTIFLDEVGELPIELQAKLLRVLQEGEIERVGSSSTRKVDVRVIAATNRDLLSAIQNGEFREDLYYRLAVFPLELPPLRERGDDVCLLAADFLKTHAQRIGKAIAPLSDRDRSALRAYPWPGNVRELYNVIERAVITAVDGTLNLERALPSARQSPDRTPAAGPAAGTAVLTSSDLQKLERDNILRALEASGWRVSGDAGAASLLGMNASTLSSRMKALGIQRRR